MVRSRDVVQAEGSARTEGARRATSEVWHQLQRTLETCRHSTMSLDRHRDLFDPGRKLSTKTPGAVATRRCWSASARRGRGRGRARRAVPGRTAEADWWCCRFRPDTRWATSQVGAAA